MTGADPGSRVRSLAADAVDSGDPTAWFEQLYASAEAGDLTVPWSDGGSTRLLVEWADQRRIDGTGRHALVVGCGLGDDAEFIASLGFHTLAFDVAPTAVAVARRRFPRSVVEYRVADLLDPPPEWRQAFDLVVEVLTVQSLPGSLRYRVIGTIAAMVAPGGTLFVVSGSRNVPLTEVSGPPWPLDRTEIEAFAEYGLTRVGIEALPPSGPGTGTWRAEFRRPDVTVS